MTEGAYSNIRDILRPYMGARIIDITQHDENEFNEAKTEGREGSYVMLMFDNGGYIKFPITDDGFDLWGFDDAHGSQEPT